MKILVMSDLHFEFHSDVGDKFLSQTNPSVVDAVIIAGDIANWAKLNTALEKVCDTFATVIYVPGNHDYYYSDFDAVRRTLWDASERFDNLHVLDRGTMRVGDKRIVGCTLWFRDGPENARYESELNDFLLIRDFRRRVYQENEMDMEYLRNNVEEGDIVVTHHMPSEKSVAPDFIGSPVNRFFVCDMEEMIRSVKPTVWIHGHTHVSMDYRIEGTRILCNPYGYDNVCVNDDFDIDLSLDILD